MIGSAPSLSAADQLSSGNSGSQSISGGGSYGISATMIAILAGAALLGFVIFLKLRAPRGKR